MEQLVKETMESCREYIPKLIETVSKIALYIQGGNEATGIRLIPPVFEGLLWVIDAVQGIQRHGFLEEIDLPDIIRHLKDLEHALEIRDHVLIADLFEYEIGPALEIWLEKIEQCQP